MAFDFPNTPSVGDLFQDSSSGAVYRWNGYAWIGGVTGIGLQTIKETRYLVAGSFTHTRDPKNSSGLADVWVWGAQGGRPAQAWSSGQFALAGGGGMGALTIKWKYPLAPSCPVIVGAGGGVGQASSFDTVLTANGGGIGNSSVTAGGTANAVGGGSAGAAGSTGDENYTGMSGAPAIYTGVTAITVTQSTMAVRDVIRHGAPAGATNAAISAATGEAGVVWVREYLNP
jgi:hypothetical protein